LATLDAKARLRDIAKITSGNLRCVLRRVEAIGGQLRKAPGVIVQSLDSRLA
jgi:hypothetical protein